MTRLNTRFSVKGISLLNSVMASSSSVQFKKFLFNQVDDIAGNEVSPTKQARGDKRASQEVDWSWSQCIKSHHAQTSSGKGLPSHFWTRDNVRSILPGLWRKITQWSKVLFSDESKFCIWFGNKVPESGGRVKRHRIHVAWSPVWSFHSQWWFGLPSHLLVLVHCVFWSPQSTQPSTRKLESTSCFLLLTSFMEMLI